MSDRVNALTVVLERDIRKDDCAALIAAIEQLRGVLKVSCRVADISDHIAQARAKRELGERLISVLDPEAP